jgi:hypothetical protein
MGQGEPADNEIDLGVTNRELLQLSQPEIAVRHTGPRKHVRRVADPDHLNDFQLSSRNAGPGSGVTLSIEISPPQCLQAT